MSQDTMILVAQRALDQLLSSREVGPDDLIEAQQRAAQAYKRYAELRDREEERARMAEDIRTFLATRILEKQ